MDSQQDRRSLLPEGRTFGVIGAGVMGRTLLKGLLEVGAIVAGQAWASAKTSSTCDAVSRELGIPAETDVSARIADAGIIVICLKPSQAPGVLAQLRHQGLTKDALLISIMAGLAIAEIESLTGTSNPWVRAMPNTPCIVREGMTVICRGTHATADHLTRAEQIFNAVGKCVAGDESHFNAITALSGSGPAWHYLFIEAFADAGVRVGLPRQLALTLVAQTAVGAARMVQVSGRHPAALRDDVTTPAGCTIAGLLMLEDGKIRSVLARAIEEATRVAATLGQPSLPKGK